MLRLLEMLEEGELLLLVKVELLLGLVLLRRLLVLVVVSGTGHHG